MKIIFEENSKEYKEAPSSEEIIEQIDEWIQDEFYFSHLVIDGVEVYEDLQSYLFEDDVQVVEVMARTKQQLLDEVIISAVEYCQRASSMLPVLVRSFSRMPYEADWVQFAQMMEGIEWLHHMIQLVDEAKERKQTNELIIIGAHLDVLTKKFLKAFENDDYLIISRHIQKELIPVYETLELEISRMLA